MPTTTTASVGQTGDERPGDELRAARQRAGLTRAQLAALAGCSLAQLGNLEQGAIPRRSAVLGRARAVIASYNDARPADQPGAVTTSTAGTGRHAEP